jgi:hypothetical protein
MWCTMDTNPDAHALRPCAPGGSRCAAISEQLHEARNSANFLGEGRPSCCMVQRASCSRQLHVLGQAQPLCEVTHRLAHARD